MALIVQKFGGTSVANLDYIKRVAQIIMNARKQGHAVIAVVSAMAGETDRLVHLAYQMVTKPNKREYDALVSTGEQVTAALLSMCLIEQGLSSHSYTGTQVGIQTDSEFGNANVEKIEVSVLKADLEAQVVPVVSGFQGVDAYGHITTLGRGGSDITAVALAAALQADECQVYTDVDGVYTSDPNIVKEARMLHRITCDEMLELSDSGAKVLQVRAAKLAYKNNIPVRILSTFREGTGTLIIASEHDVKEPTVSGIAFDRNQAKLTVLGLSGKENFAQAVMSVVSQANIDIDMLIKNRDFPGNHQDFSFTVPLYDYQRALSLVEKIANDFTAKNVLGDESIAKLSLIGLGMKSHAGVACKMFHVLGKEGIDIHMITSSEVKVSAVINEKYMELAARILHSAFVLDSSIMKF